METKERNKKVEDIMVLDRGKNMVDMGPLIFLCCGGMLIPIRVLP